MRIGWTIASGDIANLSNDEQQDPDQDKLDGFTDVNAEPDFGAGAVQSALAANADELSTEPMGYDDNDMDDFNTGTTGPTVTQTDINPDNSYSGSKRLGQWTGSIDGLTAAIQSALSDDLRNKEYQGDPNPLTGHCYVASEAAYHLLGGREAGWKPMFYSQGRHWWLENEDGRHIDITAGQFPGPYPYENGKGKGFLTAQPSKRAQVVIDRVQGRKTSAAQWIDNAPGMVAPRSSEGLAEHKAAKDMYEGHYSGPLYHGTLDRAAIEQSGFRLPIDVIHGADYGRAVYLAKSKQVASSYGRVMEVHLAPGTRILDIRFPVAEPVIGDWGDTAPSRVTEAAVRAAGFDGVCDSEVVAIYDPTKIRIGRTARKEAAWADVQSKAQRIYKDGGVRIISVTGPYIAGHVKGSEGTYETTLQRGQSGSIDQWTCSCPWFAYSFGRSGRWKKYEGRMCSHALALQYKAQSEGMFGREIKEDTQSPGWDKEITYYEAPPPKDWRASRTARHYYHAAPTSKRKDIEREGLRTDRGSLWHDAPGVYLFDGADAEEGIDQADTYGSMMLGKLGISDYDIWQVDLDPADVTSKGAGAGALVYRGNVDPSRIKRVAAGAVHKINSGAPGWTECGIRANQSSGRGKGSGQATHDIEQVTCKRCLSRASTATVLPTPATRAYLRIFASTEDEARDSDGKWTDEDGGKGTTGFGKITPGEARGDSKKVSPEEFDELAAKGKEHYDRLLADKRPTTAFNDEDQWKDICSGAYKAAQESWGGQTIDPATGKAIERSKGFSLQVRAPGEKQLTVPEDASEDEFNEMMERARKEYAEKLKGKEVYLGVFRDDDNNRIDFDPVTIVDTEAEVDSLGAYTHAVGGAYDFATGNGHFPPHVGSVNRNCPGPQQPATRIELTEDDGKKRYTHACPECGKNVSVQRGSEGVTAHAPADAKYHQREINKLEADKDGWFRTHPNAQQALLDHHVGWLPGGKTASLSSDIKDAVHVWSTIKVNNQKALPNPEHDGFRYAFHQILGDVGSFRYNASDPAFMKGEHEATVFLKAFMDNQTPAHRPLYRAIGLHPAAYMEILSAATAGSLDLPPASWSANKKLTEQFGLDYMQGTKKYEERIIFVTRPGTKSWPLGRTSMTSYEREHIVGGRFHVVNIKFPPETDNTTIITLQETEGWPEDFASTSDMIEHMAFDSAVVSPQDTGKTAAKEPYGWWLAPDGTLIDVVNSMDHFSTPHPKGSIHLTNESWGLGGEQIRLLSAGVYGSISTEQMKALYRLVYSHDFKRFCGSIYSEDGESLPGFPGISASMQNLSKQEIIDQLRNLGQMAGSLHTARFLTIEEARAGMIAADHVDPHKGTMIAVRPPESVCQELALPGSDAEPVEQLHVTLAYIGPDESENLDLDLLRQIVDAQSQLSPYIPASLSGHGTFENPDGDVSVVLVDSEELHVARALLVAALERAGIEVSREHSFTPHITLTYGDPGELEPVDKQPFYFTEFIISPPSGVWERYELATNISLGAALVTADQENPIPPTHNAEPSWGSSPIDQDDPTGSPLDADGETNTVLPGAQAAAKSPEQKAQEKALRRHLIDQHGMYRNQVNTSNLDRLVSIHEEHCHTDDDLKYNGHGPTDGHSHTATLDEEPEGALPSTDGDAGADGAQSDQDYYPSDEQINSKPYGGEGAAPSTIAWLDPRISNKGVKGNDDMDIAAAARNYLTTSTAVKSFTYAEQQEIINEGEGVTAANLDRLSLAGTHYEQLEEQLARAEAAGEPVLWW